MSKLIVEMDNPICCGACKCRYVESYIGYVAVFCTIKDNLYVEDPDSRPSWCPICGILPDEHGDLIDRDKLLHDTPRYYFDDSSSAIDVEDIKNAEAIITAERKDDGTTIN